MLIKASAEKIKEFTALLAEELAGDDKEMIATIKAALTLGENYGEMTEKRVDELLRIIRERKEHRRV